MRRVKPPRHCRPIKVPAMEKKLQYKAFETVEKQSLEGYKEWLPDNNGGERRRDLSGEPCLPCTVVAQWCAAASVQWGKQVLGGWMGGGNPEYKVYTQPAREREGKKHAQTHTMLRSCGEEANDANSPPPTSILGPASYHCHLTMGRKMSAQEASSSSSSSPCRPIEGERQPTGKHSLHGAQQT